MYKIIYTTRSGEVCLIRDGLLGIYIKATGYPQLN